MNIKLKKALYESIMKSVAKQVKKTLNEYLDGPEMSETYDTTVHEFFTWAAGELTLEAFEGLDAKSWCGFEDDTYFSSNKELLNFVFENATKTLYIRETHPMRNFYLMQFEINDIPFKCYCPFQYGEEIDS